MTASARRQVAPPVELHSVATAFPPFRFGQKEIAAKAAEVFGHKPELMQRMMRTYGNAGVETRHSCVPLEWYGQDHGWPERMRLFEENAVALLTQAGRAALDGAGICADQIAATVTVCSTGISTPSLDSLIQGPLGLRPTVQRLPVFGLGCAGGVIGLARAAAMARAMPGAWILFLCTELCGLTFRRGDDSKANIIGTTIFGDGAAAVVLRALPDERPAGPRTGTRAVIEAWGEHTWPDTRGIMGWTVEDDGLGVVFSAEIPNLIKQRMRPATDAFLAANGLAPADIAGYIVHPGGEKVVAALEDVYGFEYGGLADARAVLAACGNMSAVTVLAVLERTLARKARGRHLMGALGPGFSAAFSVLDLQ
ncbi:MAG: type III polyketide synthase [Rhodobacteraceae bacterium]|nr:type III polyketide synthase [Paracoccaceae bacterium]